MDGDGGCDCKAGVEDGGRSIDCHLCVEVLQPAESSISAGSKGGRR